MIKGSCLCEEIKYEYHGSFNEVAVCHCNQCKKAQGTPFVTNAPVELSKFSFLQGAELAKAFFSSPNKKRVFCSNCSDSWGQVLHCAYQSSSKSIWLLI